MIGAVFAVPIAALAVWQSRDLMIERRDEADSQLAARAHDAADDVSQVLNLRLEEIERMAGRVELLDDWSDTRRLRGIFDDRSGASGFVLVYLNDRYGTAVLASPERSKSGELHAGINYSDRPYYRRLLATMKSGVGDAAIGRRTRQPHVSLVAPVKDRDGSLRGFVAGALQVAELQVRVENNARAAQMRIVLTDATGAVVVDSAHHLGFLEPYPLPRQTSPDSHGSLRTLVDHGTGEELRRASSPLASADTGWRVYVSTPTSQIAARIEEIRGSTLWASLVVLALGMLIAYLLALTARSDMTRFNRLQLAIGRGDYSRSTEPVSPMMPREVHAIWADMDVMLERLEAQRLQRLQLIADLQHANEHARSLAAGLRDTNDGFVVLDRERRVVYVNPAWLRMRDRQREEVLGQLALELDPSAGANPAQVEAAEAALRAKRPWSGTVQFRGADGGAREVDLSISPVFDDQGEVEHYVELARDVTARREAEAALQQTERLASLGMLAAGIAHEINNPMTYVLGNLEHLSELTAERLLLVEPAAELDLETCLDDCIHGARRVVEIVADMRSLSQQRQDSRSAVASALQTLETCLRMAQGQLRHRAEVVRRFPTEDLWFNINPQRLSQVLLNLILNAAHAMEKTDATSNKLTVTVRRRPDGRGELSVADSGTGMSLEVAQRIFDPFFTTKGTGGGTGLGLSICHSIVTAAHGEILVESELGKGTCFRIVLPLAPLVEETAATQTTSLHGLSVLVVDDEPGVLTAIRRMLASCRTSTATSVKQALEMLEHDHYDLVLSDVMMAEVSGVELVHTLRSRAPELAKRVCLMSGGVIGGALAQEVKSIGVPLLHKPMTRGELHEALWAVHRGSVGDPASAAS
jgi:PAS domain S-box-containing protein